MFPPRSMHVANVLVMLLGLVTESKAGQAPRKPNIVVILADDKNY